MSTTTWSHLLLIATACCAAGSCGSSSSSPTAPTCRPSIAADQLSRTVDGAGGTLTIPVTAAAGCGWTAQSNASFLTIGSAAGSGTGLVTVTVPANAGDNPRTGTIIVAGQTVTITQPAQPCSTSLAPSTLTVDDTATVVTIAVTAAPACTWSARSNAAFITASAGSTAGSGSVNVTVSANPGSPRSGTVTIGSQTLTVNQRQACGYTVSATTLTIAAGGADTTVSVSTAAGCTWSASSNSSFITLSSAAANTGSGAATFTVAPNAGASRAGTLTVAGHTVSVVQAGTTVISACVTRICALNDPLGNCTAAAGFEGNGGIADVLLYAPATCNWFVTADSWLTSDPPVGTGNATIHLHADPNPLPALRYGSVTAGGASITTVESSCVVTLSPANFNVPAEGATVSLAVFTICPSWSVRGNSPYPYITILDGGPGSGNGTVTFSVAPNPGGLRTAVFGVNFAAVTVKQAGS